MLRHPKQYVAGELRQPQRVPRRRVSLGRQQRCRRRWTRCCTDRGTDLRSPAFVQGSAGHHTREALRRCRLAASSLCCAPRAPWHGLTFSAGRMSGANWVEEDDECSVSSRTRVHKLFTIVYELGFSSMMLLDELADECEVKQVKSSSLTLTDLT